MSYYQGNMNMTWGWGNQHSTPYCGGYGSWGYGNNPYGYFSHQNHHGRQNGWDHHHHYHDGDQHQDGDHHHRDDCHDYDRYYNYYHHHRHHGHNDHDKIKEQGHEI